MQQVLIAIDGFTDEHVSKIDRTLEGWARSVRIPQNSPESVYLQQLHEARVVVGWPQPKWMLGSSVDFFQLASVGYDNYLNCGLENMASLRICNLNGVLVIPIAEQVIAGMFCLTRGLHHHVVDRMEKRWERLPCYWEISGATVCIVGMGGIGTEVAWRCHALGMKVLGVARHPEKVSREFVAHIFPWNEMTTAISQADHVVLCFPATEQYRNMFDRAMFQQMKHGAFFHNVGRGSVVDEAALVDALNRGQLAGAALDVFQQEPLPVDSPLWSRDDVLITPHSAGRSLREFDRICDLFVENLSRFKNSEPLLNQIQLNA